MKKTTSVLLALLTAAACLAIPLASPASAEIEPPPGCEGDGPYPDVPATNLFCGEIAWASDMGILSGYGDGSFRPAAPLTRQSFAAMILRPRETPPPSCAEVTGSDEGPYPDVPLTNPFCSEIAIATYLEFVNGYPDGTFRPTKTLTRQAFAAVVVRSRGVEDPPECTEDLFADVPADHPFCAEIQWMVDNGVTQGYADNTFRPASDVSRQAMAAFIWRLFEELAPV